MRALRIALAVGLVTVCLAAIPVPAQSAPPVSVRVELSQKFFYMGEPLWVRITVRNDGTDPIDNPVRSDLFKGFEVQVPGSKPLESRGKPDVLEPGRPKTLAPRAFYGTVVDLAQIYPQLHQVGTYQIHWSGNGLLSDRLTVKVIPKFDPEKQYVAEISTNLGRIKIDLFPEAAPIAVKAFVDMANSGFYDALQFHEVRPDVLISGGNVAFGAPRERHPFNCPAEFSKVPLLAGTVVMKPVGAAPPSNGSEFIILLRPQQGLAGQATAIGQVVQGLEIARAISNRPSSGQKSRPFFKPLQEITIRNIGITERSPSED